MKWKHQINYRTLRYNIYYRIYKAKRDVQVIGILITRLSLNEKQGSNLIMCE